MSFKLFNHALSLAAVLMIAACQAKNVTQPATLPAGTSALGTDSSGGGDSIVSVSTSEEVQSSLERVKSNVLLSVTTALWRDKQFLKDPDLISIVSKMLDGGTPSADGWRISSTPIESDIELTNLNILKVGDCLTFDGQPVDASVSAFQNHVPICFSIERLRRIPREALHAQLTALAAHEFAHHFGFGENETQKFQHYFLDEVITGKAEARSANWADCQKVIDALAALSSAPSCNEVSKLNDIEKIFGMYVVNNNFDMTVGNAAMKSFRTDRIEPLIARLKSFEDQICRSQPPVDSAAKLSRDLLAVQHDLVFVLYGMNY